MDTGDNGLPAGVVDAVLNRGELARALNKSEPTIDRYIDDGMPCLVEGTNGRAWEFQLSACWTWLQDRDRAEQDKRSVAETAVQQMRLALIGGNDVADADRVLSPKQRQEAYDAERAFMLAALQRADLVRRGDVVEAWEEVFKIFREEMTAFPDRLEREVGLTGKALIMAIELCDNVLAQAEKRIGLLTGDAAYRQAAE
jgi:phage terminase Nu1 subunit (DNA packaging protein)